MGRDALNLAAPLAASGATRYNWEVASKAQPAPVKVLFFGRLKEIVGTSEDLIQLAEGALIESLFGTYVARHPQLMEYRSSLVASCNQEFVPWDTPLHCGDEVAFLPPVSGG